MGKKMGAGLALLMLVSGCAGIPSFRMQQSQGLTGCLTSEMKFTDLNTPGYAPGGGPWLIQCRGKTYLCNQTGDTAAACHER